MKIKTLIKIIKYYYYPLIFLYFFLNIIRLIPLFMFDYYIFIKNSEIMSNIFFFIIFLLFLLLLLLLLIEIVLFYPAFKQKGFSFVEVFIYNKNDFNKIVYIIAIFLFWINVIILLLFGAIGSVRSDGQPTMIESSYYFVSHGDIIEEISYSEYKLYSLLDIQWAYSMAVLIFFLMGGFAKHFEYILD